MIKSREERSSKSPETLTDPKWGKHKFISVNGESMRSVLRKLLDSWHIHESAWVVLSSAEMMIIFCQEMMRMMKMKLLIRWWCWTVKHTGVRLHYVEAGREDAPLLLFVHGFPEFWFVLKSFIKPYRRWTGQEPRNMLCWRLLLMILKNGCDVFWKSLRKKRRNLIEAMMALRFIIINKDGSLSKDFNDFLMKWPGFLGVTSSSTSSKSSEWSPLTTGVDRLDGWCGDEKELAGAVGAKIPRINKTK